MTVDLMPYSPLGWQAERMLFGKETGNLSGKNSYFQT